MHESKASLAVSALLCSQCCMSRFLSYGFITPLSRLCASCCQQWSFPTLQPCVPTTFHSASTGGYTAVQKEMTWEKKGGGELVLRWVGSLAQLSRQLQEQQFQHNEGSGERW